MRYEDVNSNQELNQKITDYVTMGYKVENRTISYTLQSKFKTDVINLITLFKVQGFRKITVKNTRLSNIALNSF